MKLLDDPRKTEIARRIGEARFACKNADGVLKSQPCSACHSAIFSGCVYLAEAILQPEFEQGGIYG